ncbi:DUF3306 domain-containing protein [Loktanella sp. R86503]|uniref:DUF3306 domain-containing protein n=1 Tax=Loktanella sp. R86503 TaxID=3093847 RepID=UPI0036DD4D28
MSQEQSFFARRRAGLKAEREAELAAATEDQTAADGLETQQDSPDLTDMSDAEILDLLDLPDPDSLRKGDNFAAFMAKAVPLHLRNRALRNLWRSDPVLACLDGLNDYDADYLTGSTGQGVIQTSYQVGRGLLAHVEKMAQDAAVADTPSDDTVAQADTGAADGSNEVSETLAFDDQPQHSADEAGPDAPQQVAGDDEAPAPRAPRRMRFEFGDRT